MTVIKRILLTVFLAVTGLSLSAQEKPDSTAYRFRFVAENDMFFSPWSGNGQELERLLAAIDEHRPAIEAGQMYLLVTSYATDGNEDTPQSCEVGTDCARQDKRVELRHRPVV